MTTEWVIGIDPSSSHTSSDNMIGFSVFCNGELLQHGEIIPDPDMGFTRVRRWLRDKFRSIEINDSSPAIFVGVETAWLGKNPNVFLGLIRIKSHIEATTLDSGYSYIEISPLTSFQAATGMSQYPVNSSGRRSNTRKPAIQASVKIRYNIIDDISEHEYDAIAIGMAVIKRLNNGKIH